MSESQGQPYEPGQPNTPPGGPSEPSGFSGMFQDPSTLASTGLLTANLLAICAGLINFLGNPGILGFRGRLLALTTTVDVGDIALVGIAVALLVVTPDPPGGIPRKLLLQVATGLAGIITLFGAIRALELLTESTGITTKLAGFLATVGVMLAAATVSFYAARASTEAD